MMTNHFCGFLDCGQTRETLDPDAKRDLQKRASVGLTSNSAHVVESLDQPPLFVATCSFDSASHSIRRRPAGIGIVAGDPVFCGENDAAAPFDVGLDGVVDALLGERFPGLANARGNFAAIAWNPTTRRLVIATDKLGVRPIYIAVYDRFVIFGTKIRAAIQLLGFRPQWDEQGLAETIYFGQCFGDRTPYSGLSCLRPGELVLVGPSAKPERRNYFDLAATPASDAGTREPEGLVQDAFMQAVKRRSRDTVEYAFLSGGLDTRAVVDSLLSIGREVQTFGSSWPQSIDDVVSADAARRLGLNHIRHHREPSDRLKYDTDQYALFARGNFPPMKKAGHKAMWSGDGGSVTLGHVYLTAERVERASRAVTTENIRALFPVLCRERPSRHLGRAFSLRLRELAEQGAADELRRVAHARPDRRLFLFYMNNDQARHLHSHFEVLDKSEIEFHTPFFDSDFAAMIASLPIAPFLRHDLYNRWMLRFHARSAAFYWQEYPGHVPSPHRRPEGAIYQWDESWFSGPKASSMNVRIADSVLEDEEALSGGLINPWVLRLTKLLNRVGQNRFDYEVDFARRISDLYHPVPRG